MSQNLSFELEIVHPFSSEKFDVLWVEIESPTGSFLVGPMHCNLISLLKPNGRLIFKKKEDDKEMILLLSNGIFKFFDNKATAIID